MRMLMHIRRNDKMKCKYCSGNGYYIVHDGDINFPYSIECHKCKKGEMIK
jgi:hypothetical protein